MPKCEKCGKILRDRYNLSRHQSRLKPCVEKLTKIEEGAFSQKQSLLSPKQPSLKYDCINNNIILNFDKEILNDTRFQTENIINLRRNIRKEFGDRHICLNL